MSLRRLESQLILEWHPHNKEKFEMSIAIMHVELVITQLICAYNHQATSGTFQRLNQRSGYWVCLEGPWERSPSGLGYEELSTRGRVMKFTNDGKFIQMRCLFRRIRRSWSISPGDGLEIYQGSWLESSDGLRVDYQLTESTLAEENLKIPSHIKFGRIKFKNNNLIFENMRYFELDKRSSQNFNFFFHSKFGN